MMKKQILSIGTFFLLFIQTVSSQPVTHTEAQATTTHNVIMFISDGCGPASFTMARDYVRDYLGDSQLAVDAIQVGAVRTRASNSRITDSAASGTAMACGIKTYNGAIAVDTLAGPVATILEAAEAKGMATGLVSTSRITHATPAAFSSHVRNRGLEAQIAEQQITKEIEVILGGGTSFYLPVDAGGRRQDGRNLLDEMQGLGYQVVSNTGEMKAATDVPLIGLFTVDHMAYEIDRDPVAEPSIEEMTTKAITLLSQDPDGFFLMVEGSRIDHAGHGHDAAAHLHDLLAYDRAVAAALTFARNDGRTLVVSVSDHETGGLTVGRPGDGNTAYGWNPEVLAGVRSSLEMLVPAVSNGEITPAAALQDYLGLGDVEEEEIAYLESAVKNRGDVGSVLANAVNQRALLGWTSGGHTAVDVNLYAFGPGRERLIGNHENTYIVEVIAELMDFDLVRLTEALREE